VGLSMLMPMPHVYAALNVRRVFKERAADCGSPCVGRGLATGATGRMTCRFASKSRQLMSKDYSGNKGLSNAVIDSSRQPTPFNLSNCYSAHSVN